MDEPIQKLTLADQFFAPLAMGAKHGTVRKGIRDIKLGHLDLVSPDEKQWAQVYVKSITFTHFGQLTAEDAKMDGYESVAALQSALREFYPDIDFSTPVTIVRWG